MTIGPQTTVENEVILTLNQALWGLVSPDLHGVAVQVTDRQDITIYFAVRKLDEEMQQDIDDIADDYEAFTVPDEPHIEVVVHVGSARSGWEGRDHRLVYLSKYESPEGESNA